MRCFVGVIPPYALNKKILNLQSTLEKKYSISTKSVPHITLKMLGELSKSKVEELEKVLEGFKSNSFQVKLRGFGYFEASNVEGSINVLYLNVKSHGAKSIHRKLLDMVGQFNADKYPFELEDYQPHLSLATEGITNEKLTELKEEYSRLPFNDEFIANEIILFTKKPNEKIYSLYRRYKLQ